MANECQKIAVGPIYMFTADDFFFESKSWDTEVIKAFDQYEDKIVLVCPEGRYWKNWRIGVIGFLHKNWVDTVGYLLPTYEGSQAADRWVNALAVSLGRRVRLTNVLVTHSNHKDEVHTEKNKLFRRRGWSQKYYTPEMEEQRIVDAAKLHDRILHSQSRTA